MKQSRRKDLKTNELGIWLNDLYDSAQRNANYLLGGLLVVVLIVVATMVIRHNRMAKVQSAWSTYYDLRAIDPTKDPDALNRARDLAQAWTGDPELGPFALQLSGDMAYIMSTSEKDKTVRLERLNQARSSYEQMLADAGSESDVANAARMSLATVEESLIVEGQGSAQKVRELYEKVIASKPNAFVAVAQQKLNTLDERLKPLQIVATRPAEPTATAPAATRPNVASRPTLAAPRPAPRLKK